MSERERFEAWAHGKSWSTSRYSAKAVKGGAYRNWHVEAAWLAWQAAQRIDVTPIMVEAAEDAYMPFGDMYMALQAAFAHSGGTTPGVAEEDGQ